MNKKTIRSFYLSLIDNPEAEWTSEKDGDCTLYHCQINKIKVKMHRDYQICFKYTGSTGWGNDSDYVKFSDIGISNFHLFFPYLPFSSWKEPNFSKYLFIFIFLISSSDKSFVALALLELLLFLISSKES